jgi:hypothetical protein
MTQATRRSYTRVTPEVEADILAARTILGPAASQAEIGQRTGYSTSTVKYVLTDLPRLRRVSDNGSSEASLRGRIRDTLRGIPDGFATVADLRAVLGQADTAHDIVHVLFAMRKQGLVEFSERGSETGKSNPVNIRWAKRSPKPKVEDHGPAPEVESAEAQPDEVIVLIPPTYPLLDALIEREGKRLDADNRAMAYLNAAESLRDLDPDTYTTLVEKAAQADIPFPSPIEAEYLRYVADHPKKETPRD